VGIRKVVIERERLPQFADGAGGITLRC
jgi:hypothetical protein